MGLLQNGYRDFSSGVRIIGATVSNSGYPYSAPGNWCFTSTRRNLTAGEGINTDKAGIPDGYRNQYAWLQPQKAGAIASRNQIFGDGEATASIAGGVNGEATLAGTGTLTGTGALIISMVAALTGSGTITDADIVGYLQLAATLAGEGDLAGAATAIGHAAAALSGSGDADGLATALGTLAAEITVTGDLLTTANVGDAVWAVLIEAGLTAQQAMRVIAAATAGKVSGAETATITFRNAVADNADRIVATVSSGNRTAITYDLD